MRAVWGRHRIVIGDAHKHFEDEDGSGADEHDRPDEAHRGHRAEESVDAVEAREDAMLGGEGVLRLDESVSGKAR